mmetsp:Transcript_1615/g.4403  ORF Transcript_1615/g.4403 Transcript_1615/m.4403 type:complete len:498 (+) Transcript_1615:66-1559(+)
MGEGKSAELVGGEEWLYSSGWQSLFLPGGSRYRFIILFTSCMLTFGSYMVFDMPGTLEEPIEDALSIGTTKFGLFYSLYAWTNALFVILAGILIDRLNTRVGVLLFTLLILSGQSLFALGGTVKSYWVMCVGRFVFGSGGGSVTIAQYAIASQYFKGKELALAFGLTTMASRLGSVINFLFFASLEEATSLVFVLWLGTIMCVLSFISGLTFAWLDFRHERVMGLPKEMTNSRKVNFKDVKDFPITYWILDLICSAFYITIFAFIAIASGFFQDSYGLDADIAGIVAGIPYYMSIVLSPLTGKLIDRLGHRASLLIVGCALTLPTFLLFAFTDLYPAVSMVLLGFAYVISAGCIWPSVPLLVTQNQVGSATGIMTSIQMLGIGFANIGVGNIISSFSTEVTESVTDVDFGSDSDSDGFITYEDRTKGYQMAIYFFVIVGIIATVLAIILFVLDRSRGGVLENTTSKSRVVAAGKDKEEYEHVPSGSDSDSEHEGLIN